MGKLLLSLTGLLPAMACASESFGGGEKERARGGRVCVSKMCVLLRFGFLLCGLVAGVLSSLWGR